jgi:hypothetical protein
MNTASNRGETRKPNSPSPTESSRSFGWLGATVVHAAVFCFLALLLSVGAYSQTSQGITGLVTDSTGAVIPKAKITVHNEATGIDKQAVTTTTGNYTVPFLDPGVYDVRVEAEKFESVNKTNITLLTDQTVTVSFQLSPGAVTQTVTVNAYSDVLDYVKPDRGDVVELTRIEQLPVLAGDPFNLAELSAGAMSTLAISSYNPFNQTAQSLSIHGAAVELNIDGVSDLSMTGAQNYAYDPPNASVQEFKITTNAFDAAAGRSPGGAIDLTLKTGTRRLHGAAYEVARRGFLEANTSINNANIVANGYKQAYETGQTTEDQYGLELDGPVIIPKLWHASRKTFFLLQYEKINNIQTTSVSGSVPTQAMIGSGTTNPGQGDFSSLLTVNGATYNQPIYDPLSEAVCTAHNTDNGTYAGKNPHVCRYQFGFGPGTGAGPQGNPVQIGPINVIPKNRMDSTAAAVLSWYAYPSQNPSPSTANDFNGNYGQNNPTSNYYRNYLIKLDQYQGNNDTFNLTARLWTIIGTSINGDPRYNVNPAHPGLNMAGYGAHFNNRFHDPSLVLGWTHTFSPNLINSLKASLMVTDQTDNTGPPPGFNPSTLGFSPTLAAASPQYFDRFPSITPGNYNVLGSIAGLERGDNEIVITDTMNWTHGNHTVHFGVDWRPAQYSQRISNAAGNSINLSVGKGWTQQWDTVVTGGATGISTSAGYSGNSIASMLLSTWDSGNATTQPNNYYSFKYGAAFFQDDWKVRPNLVINLGLRWDKPINGSVDRQNRQVYTFDGTDVNPISSLVSASALPISGSLLGGITFAGVNGNPRAPFAPVNFEFGPRGGFAYTFNQKTVIRGGMGLYYADNGTTSSPPQTGFQSTTTYTGSLDGGATPLLNLSNPFPNLQTPTGNCGGNQSLCLETNAGQTVSFYNPHYRPAQFLETSFNIERQLTKWDTIEVAYAGTRGYSTAYSDDLNHISAAAQAACDPERGGVGTNCTSGASTGTIGYINNPFKGLAPFAASGTFYTASTIQRINFTRPFPIFYNGSLGGTNASVTENNLMGGKFWYNAAEVTYNHRTSIGLTLHGTYTYSKAMSAAGYTDYVNRILSRVLTGSDNPHRVTVSGVYLLPIGQGRGLFPGINRYADLVVGGWQVGSIFTYQSGLPFAIGGYEINRTANGGYILPRKRFFPGNSNAYWPGSQGAGKNSYVQAFKPCVGTRDPNTGVVTLESFSVTAGCQQANFVQILANYGQVPNYVYSGIRMQHIVNDDSNISKDFNVEKRAGMVFQLRMDAFNAMNHVIQNSGGYDTTVNDANFGTYQMGTSGGGNYPNRQIQISGHLTW